MRAFFLGIALLGAVMAPALQADAQNKAKKPIPATVVVAGQDILPDMMLGDPKAKITIIEYASTSCPHCRDWNRDVFPYIEDTYIRTGKVKFIYREVMTPPEPYALSSYMIGRCLVNQSNNKNDARPYFTVLETYFASQAEFAQSRQFTGTLSNLAKATGKDEATLRECLNDEPLMKEIMHTMDVHLEADKIESTPTFFVNGKRMTGRTQADFDAAIKAANH